MAPSARILDAKERDRGADQVPFQISESAPCRSLVPRHPRETVDADSGTPYSVYNVHLASVVLRRCVLSCQVSSRAIPVVVRGAYVVEDEKLTRQEHFFEGGKDVVINPRFVSFLLLSISFSMHVGPSRNPKRLVDLKQSHNT